MRYALTIAAVLAASVSTANAVEDGCAIVRNTPDGFLNLREFPLGNARVVTRLKPGDLLSINSGSCQKKGSIEVCREDGNWTSVDDAMRGRKLVWGKKSASETGWVATRFLRFLDCETLTSPP
jgi:hypothetical protein